MLTKRSKEMKFFNSGVVIQISYVLLIFLFVVVVVVLFSGFHAWSEPSPSTRAHMRTLARNCQLYTWEKAEIKG
jgi:hypothetical protein